MRGDHSQGGQYQLDPQSLELRCGSTLIHLKKKPAELLLFLMSKPNQVLSRDQISNRIWKNRVVTDALIKDYISIIRKALDDSASAPRFIETLRGKGYRYIGNISLKPFKYSGKFAGGMVSKTDTNNRRPTLYITCPGNLGNQCEKIEILSLEVASMLTKYPDLTLVDFYHDKTKNGEIANPAVDWVLKLGHLGREEDSHAFAKLINLKSNCIYWLEGFDWSNVTTTDKQKKLVIRITAAVLAALRKIPEESKEPIEMNHPGDYVLLGHRLMKESVLNVPKAMQAFETALAMNSSLAEAMTGIALCHRQEIVHGFYPDLEIINEKSLEFSKNAYSLNSRETLNTILFAQALASSGDYQAADVMHLKAMEQDPAGTDAIVSYGLYQCQVSKPERGIGYIRHAMSLDSKHPKWYHWILATAFYQAGKFNDALIHFQLYSRLESEAIRPLHGMAATYAQLGKPYQAEKTIDRILEYKPELNLANEYRYHTNQTFVEKDVDKWMEGMRIAGVS